MNSLPIVQVTVLDWLEIADLGHLNQLAVLRLNSECICSNFIEHQQVALFVSRDIRGAPEAKSKRSLVAGEVRISNSFRPFLRHQIRKDSLMGMRLALLLWLAFDLLEFPHAPV